MTKTKLFIFALLALTLTGCVDNRQGKSESGASRNLSSERIIRFGHNYLYFYDERVPYTPVNVIHDPDCPCWEKEEKMSDETSQEQRSLRYGCRRGD